MKQLKSIIVLLVLALIFAFSASATETYRKSDRTSYVGGQNGSAKNGSTQSATHSGNGHNSKQLKHLNNTNKLQ